MRILLTLLILACVTAIALAEDTPKKDAPMKDEPAKVPTLTDLAWLQGRWIESTGTSVFSDTWGPPQGDAIVGFSHWTIAGATRMFELMAIEKTPDGLVLRIRHFHRGLVPWAGEKDGPLTWPLESLVGQRAVFEHATRAWPKRMEYERTGDRLKGRLSGVEKGVPKVIPFDFRLVP